MKYDHILEIIKSDSSSKTAKGKVMREAVKISNRDPGLSDLVRTCTLDYKVKLDQIDEPVKSKIIERIKAKEQRVIKYIEQELV